MLQSSQVEAVQVDEHCEGLVCSQSVYLRCNDLGHALRIKGAVDCMLPELAKQLGVSKVHSGDIKNLCVPITSYEKQLRAPEVAAALLNLEFSIVNFRNFKWQEALHYEPPKVDVFSVWQYSEASPHFGSVYLYCKDSNHAFQLKSAIDCRLPELATQLGVAKICSQTAEGKYVRITCDKRELGALEVAKVLTCLGFPIENLGNLLGDAKLRQQNTKVGAVNVKLHQKNPKVDAVRVDGYCEGQNIQGGVYLHCDDLDHTMKVKNAITYRLSELAKQLKVKEVYPSTIEKPCEGVAHRAKCLPEAEVAPAILNCVRIISDDRPLNTLEVAAVLLNMGFSIES